MGSGGLKGQEDPGAAELGRSGRTEGQMGEGPDSGGCEVWWEAWDGESGDLVPGPLWTHLVTSVITSVTGGHSGKEASWGPAM